jgi:glutaminyl-peptide cyclotransferase
MLCSRVRIQVSRPKAGPRLTPRGRRAARSYRNLWVAAGGLVALVVTGCLHEDSPDPQLRIRSLTAIPREVDPGEQAELRVFLEGADGRSLTFTWQASAGRFPAEPDSACVIWEAPDSAATCRIAVRVAAGREQARDSISIVVAPRGPRLELMPATFDFGPADSTALLLIRNAGARTLAWEVTAAAPWVQVYPARGHSQQAAAFPDTVRILAARAQLEPGLHTDTLQVSSNGGVATLPLRIEVPGTPIWTYTLIDSFPHDRSAFTQGLVVEEGILYEGTGRYGASLIRAVELDGGRVLRERSLSSRYFGEGIALAGTRLVQLTLYARTAFVYDAATFELLRTFSYSSEGWGLAYDRAGDRFIRSDGSETLYFHDPQTFELLGQIGVHDRGEPVYRINELEMIDGVLFANVWKTDRVARIDPGIGDLLSWIDLAGLRELADYGPRIDVLNGIAYDEATGRLFVTGKLWPLLFEITVHPREGVRQDGHGGP